jgi:flagellar basal-body rod protein FlgB
MDISDRATKSLALSLNFRKLKNDLIASNIANAETPNYKAKKIDFEEALARAIDVDDQSTIHINNQRHFNVGSDEGSTLEPEIYDNPNGIVSEDGNTVNRDQEMAEMAENKILYDASIQLLNKKLGLMKYTLNSER